MIDDLDESLRQLLIKKGALNSTEVNISFDAPGREWTASQSRPAVNVYLYDIRENHELRSYEWTVQRNDDRTATRKKAPLRVDLSYLITVWTKDVGDEHRLLGRIMAVLCRYSLLPEEILQGALQDLEYPIRASAAQPDGLFRSPADIWGALDNQLRPSINYVVTLPIDLDIALTAPVVWTKIIDIRQEGEEAVQQALQIGGIVHEKGNPQMGIANATVAIKESGLTAKTDDRGYYSFTRLERGKYSFKVSASGWTAKAVQMAVPDDDYNIGMQRG